jgi:S-adenosylmethionine:tRNA ribosyltransferase-isomerase
MIAASVPIQRPADAKLLVVDAQGGISHHPRRDLSALLNDGDLVIANDAATVPASLFGVHLATGAPIEVRLAGRRSLDGEEMTLFDAVVFGAGDYRTRTEHRPAPPPLNAGDTMQLGGLRAEVVRMLDHPRFVCLKLEGSPREIWEALAHSGNPIQYAHVSSPLAIWESWTPIAGPPVAFEPPSAGFVLDWSVLEALRSRGVSFATITHAAGISSTGDPELDLRLPLDEPYRIPATTAQMIRDCRTRCGRVIAIGTTVVRALEHASSKDGSVRAGLGIATQRIGADTSLNVIDAIVSGTHEPGTSHYELLRAVADNETLRRVDAELEREHYKTHEFGDSVFISRQKSVAGRPDPRLLF